MSELTSPNSEPRTATEFSQSSKHRISHQYNRITITKAASLADAEDEGKVKGEETGYVREGDACVLR